MKRRIVTVSSWSVIYLGYSGDYYSTTVRFPISTILSKYGAGGTFTLLSLPPGEIVAHTAENVTKVGNYVEWDVGEEELTEPGSGKVQLVYTDADGTTHRKIWETKIERSLKRSTDN